MALLSGRRGLILGIANERSLAHGIARAARREGAALALTYQNERLRGSVEALAGSLEAELVLPCDLTRDEEVTRLRDALAGRWGRLDFLVHAVAGARREELDGRFVDTSRDGFAMALDVSVYSLVAAVRALEPLLREGEAPSVLTLTYLGAERAVPHYNVMGVAKAALEATVRYLARDLGPAGIRVNALSPGPIRTLSAAGVKGMRKMLAQVERDAPLRRNVTIDDVGDAALVALSALGRGVTGEIVHVDAGYHCIGAPGLEEG
jgi:enoyl-[acyl-carrier protein] reductase I